MRIKKFQLFAIVAATLLVALVVLAGCAQQAAPPATTPATPTATPKPTSTPSSTPSPAPVPSPTPTPTPSPTPTSSPAAKTYTLKLTTYTVQTHAISQTIQHCIDLTKEKSGGRLIIEPFYGGILYKSGQEIPPVNARAVDMCYAYMGYYPEITPSTMICETAFCPPRSSAATFKAFIEGGIDKMLNEEIGKNSNTLSVAWFFTHTGDFANNKVLIKKPGDAKGLKIRSPAPVYSKWIEMMGASPVSLTASDMYMGLKLGVIDGTIAPHSGYVPYKYGEVCDYYSMIVATENANCILMNKDSYASLPPDLQKVMQDAWLMEFGQYYAAENDKLQKQIREAMKKDMTESIEFTADDVKVWTDAYRKPLLDWLVTTGKANPDIVSKALAIFDKYK